MITLFDYCERFDKPCQPCTPADWQRLTKRATDIVRRYRATHYDKLKRSLPAVCWQAHFSDGHRSNKSAVFSGLFQLDIDHVDNPKEMFDQWGVRLLESLGVKLVFITPSGKGLKLVAQMIDRPNVERTIEAHQAWLASALGLKEYDACTKDLARMSFVPAAGDILFQVSDLWEIDNVMQLSSESSATPSVGQSAPTADLAEYSASVEVKGQFEIYGKPMVDYVLAWFALNGGNPKLGERNNKIYRCALYFRNFTDFNARILAENIPSFGLSQDEMLQVCKSACTAMRSLNYYPRNVKDLLQVETHQDADSTAETNQPTELPEFPPLVQIFVEKSDPRFRTATVLAMLPILGALATDLRMEFPDGEEHSASFMSVIVAPQASGKSFARRLWRILTERLHDEDLVAWEQERKWRETLQQTSLQSKKVDGLQRDPEVVIRLVPSKITEPQFFRRLHHAKGKHLLGFYEEIDSLTKEAKGSSYDNKRDLFREAFDNAEHGRDVANVDSFSGVERIFYNFLTLGTPKSVLSFYSNAEDGLVSRTIFYRLPVDIFDELPLHQKFSQTDLAQIKVCTDFLIDLKQNLGDMIDKNGKIFLPTPEIDQIWSGWRRKAESRALRRGSTAEGIFLKRASVIAWRACCVFAVLWDMQFTPEMTEKMRKVFYWLADTIMEEQVAIFGDKLEQTFVSLNDAHKVDVFALLPDTFDRNQLQQLLHENRRTTPARTLISLWKKKGLITKEGKLFVKTKNAQKQ